MPPTPTSLTDFLIELGEKQSTRKQFRNPNKRGELLQRKGLASHPAFRPSATLADMQQAVAAEGLGGETKIEWWILVNADPVVNDQFDLS